MSPRDVALPRIVAWTFGAVVLVGAALRFGIADDLLLVAAVAAVIAAAVGCGVAAYRRRFHPRQAWQVLFAPGAKDDGP